MNALLRSISLLTLSCMLTGSFAQCPDSTVTIYSSDFESGNGGLVSGGFGDWEHGVIGTMLIDSTCTSTYNNTIGANSGVAGWGTLLRECYTNAGDTSWVELVVDLSDPNLTAAELDFWSWYEVFTNFDFLFIRVNGQQVYLNNSMQFSQNWVNETIDLSAFLGQSNVSIRWHLFATTVVNKAGWYIDDVTVLGCVPSTPTGIGETTDAGIRVWPNPAEDLLHVQVADFEGASWSLMDATGRHVRQGSLVAGTDQGAIDVEGVRGLHILELRSATGIHREQVILR
ncbi:MAG: hypothetical protein KDB88_06815 [Flavobacteriales bacterium]|nr:hypothetical protein [Flavobacteriales bacterium]